MNRKLVSKSNRVLRKILNKEENMDIFQDIIESILKINIKSIELRPYLNEVEYSLPSEENFGVADVKILTDTEEQINIGFQILDGFFIQNKILIYYAQIHVNQKEHDYSSGFNKTITINIVNEKFLNSPKYHNILTLKQKPSDKVNLEIDKKLSVVEMHTIELCKFRETKSIIKTKEDAWIAYLEGSNSKLVKMAVENFEKINKLDKLLNEYWENEVME